MTVKDFHEICVTEFEVYIDRKTNTWFILDYSDHHNEDEWITGLKTYQANLEKKVVSVWAMVDYSGKAVLVAEYQ